MSAINNKNTQAEGFRIGTQTPIDDRLVFQDLADLANLGSGDENAYRYYEGMRVWVLSVQKEYVWMESISGVLGSSFTYPSGITVNGISYSGRDFNFVFTGGSGSGGSSTEVLESVVSLVANVPEVINVGSGTSIIDISIYDSSDNDISSGISVIINSGLMNVTLESNIDLIGVSVKVIYTP